MRSAIIRGPRPGFALAAALAATILISALLASFLFAVSEETRASAATRRKDRALATAESAIEIGLQRVAASLVADGPAGSTETYLVYVDGSPTAIHLTRLRSSLIWLVAVVGDARNPGSQTLRVGVLARASRSGPDSITVVRISERGWSELY